MAECGPVTGNIKTFKTATNVYMKTMYSHKKKVEMYKWFMIMDIVLTLSLSARMRNINEGMVFFIKTDGG